MGKEVFLTVSQMFQCEREREDQQNTFEKENKPYFGNSGIGQNGGVSQRIVNGNKAVKRHYKKY